MPVNFIQHINQNTTLTAAQKLRLLDDFVYGEGYTDTVLNTSGETIPNPVSKTQFFNRQVSKYIMSRIELYRGGEAGRAANDTAVAEAKTTFQDQLGA